MNSLDDTIGFNTAKTARKITRILSNHLKESQLTAEQWGVLKRLTEQDHVTQKQLALRSDKDQPTLTKILDLLEKNGFINRQLNPNDRRSFLIVITEQGRKLVDDRFNEVELLFQKIVNHIPKEDLETFQHVLGQIQKNIDLLHDLPHNK
ncbi:MarR family transcriptional regulator [Terrilactibacillus sp. BCM23-1]|uniref:MarR family transcriptional regulator n=1 Tax=Terrilactibacillus tamarindi TaxID=2599694 RepID=A0A6N8CPV2_9BACI|nr:MarR family transcriptional regulator [Terrilactibacillus tamarindi]MTT31187.1 MarR family transcriptional regulator [Terrilactibacillus tamarindi]